MIGVARPTRGLEFAESAQSIERNLRGVPHIIERTWDQPLPDSFNYLSDLLLAEPDVTDILFVEEDVVVPQGGVEALRSVNADIVSLNYPLKPSGRISVMRDQDKNLLWVSLGCTLIKRRVFDGMQRPWFRTAHTIGSVHEGSSCKKRTYRLVASPSFPYGGQDAYFCWNAKEAGFGLDVVNNLMADHLVLVALGAPTTNDGCHQIRRVCPTGS